MSPNQQSSIEVMAYLYYRLEQFDKALILYNALASYLGNANQYAHYLAAIAIKQQRHKDAVDLINQALRERSFPSSQDRVLHLIKAQALWSQGRVDESRNSLDKYQLLEEK